MLPNTEDTLAAHPSTQSIKLTLYEVIHFEAEKQNISANLLIAT